MSIRLEVVNADALALTKALTMLKQAWGIYAS
jgi:hypothetical protein